MKCTSCLAVLAVALALPGVSRSLAQWEPDRRLTSDTSVSATCNNNGRSVAASGASVHVVWEDDREGAYAVYHKRSTNDGCDWGADTRLSVSPRSSRLPAVAASGTDVHVVWYDTRDESEEVYYKRSTDAGVTWGTDFRLTNSPAERWNPCIAVSDPTLHVVWYDSRDGNPEIYYKRNGPTGIGEGQRAPPEREQPLRIVPNLFVGHAAIAGCGQERFEVYGLDGVLVQTCPGSMVAQGLAPGVYFVRGGEVASPVRVVKVR